MCANKTLFYIEVLNDVQGVLLRDPVDERGVAAIRAGSYEGLRCAEKPGWIFARHPDKGLLGLPLNGEHNSWFEAWDNMDIEISLQPQGNHWTPIIDWNELSGIKLS